MNEKEIWRIRNNRKVEQILETENIVKYIKPYRIRWLGHVERMDEERIPKLVMLARMMGIRRQGCPRRSWTIEVKLS